MVAGLTRGMATTVALIKFNVPESHLVLLPRQDRNGFAFQMFFWALPPGTLLMVQPPEHTEAPFLLSKSQEP